MSQHEMYMRRCIELAKQGGLAVRTNPLVGSILVHNHKIIGEGYHKELGARHGERMAIENALASNPELVKDASLYVTLEPCSLHGRTPPCRDLILEAGIQTVNIGCLDPTVAENGKSLAFLKSKGVNVSMGILEEECQMLISRFKANLEKRPFITLKWAQSKDFFIGKKDEQVWISNEFSRVYAHKLRSEHDAIWVGTNTAIIDDPQLTTRSFLGANPIRIVSDRNNRIPKDRKVFADGNKTIVLGTAQSQNENVKCLESAPSLKEQLNNLFDEEIYSILVEGGATLINAFIKEGLWDEAVVITSEKTLKTGIKAPQLKGKMVEEMQFRGDRILKILNV